MYLRYAFMCIIKDYPKASAERVILQITLSGFTNFPMFYRCLWIIFYKLFRYFKYGYYIYIISTTPSSPPTLTLLLPLFLKFITSLSSVIISTPHTHLHMHTNIPTLYLSIYLYIFICIYITNQGFILVRLILPLSVVINHLQHVACSIVNVASFVTQIQSFDIPLIMLPANWCCPCAGLAYANTLLIFHEFSSPVIFRRYCFTEDIWDLWLLKFFCHFSTVFSDF